MAKPTVAVLGASRQRHKFGNKSLRAHAFKGWRVYPVNPNEVEGATVYATIGDVPEARLDRVTVYLSPEQTLGVLDEIAQKGCDELWLNPGTHNEAVLQRCRELGLNAIVGCSIVDLGLTPSQFP
jgi:predicted CoA-binding protein